MTDMLQRTRPDVSAAAVRRGGRRPAQRVRTASGREWARTPVMEPLLPALVPSPREPVLEHRRAAGPAQGPAADVADQRGRRPRLVRATAALVLNAVLLSSVAAFVGLAIGPHTGHYRTLTMLTGSMRPQFPPGSVVVVTPLSVDELRTGHVITYNAPTPDRRVVTHRVVSVDRSGDKPVVVTKGDANAGDDPWAAVLDDSTVWQARFAVPLLGDGIRLLRQPGAQLVATRVLPLLLLLWLLVSIWRSGGHREGVDA